MNPDAPSVGALYQTRTHCGLCGSAQVEIAVPLAPMPIATPNFVVPDAGRDAAVFREAVPLELALCRDCGHLQVLHIGNPDIQYRHYRYTTSVSLGLADHFARYAEETIARFALPTGAFVVEIGSNDGTLLRSFQRRGLRVLGVDPARDIARRATESGIETVGEFFTRDSAASLRERFGPADLIIANNVVANIPDLPGFAEGVRSLLGNRGAFVFETQYGVDVTEKLLLDTVYHEHIAYFNVAPTRRFLAEHGLEMFAVENIWTKGGSIRVMAQLRGASRRIEESVGRLLDWESQLGVREPAYYRRVSARISALAAQIQSEVARTKAAGRVVAGYGVSVGTTTLLSQFGLTRDIDMLFDDAADKGDCLFGPGYNIPVLPGTALSARKPGLVIVFAWRYADPIMAKQSAYLESGGEFLIPLPEVKIVRGAPR